ncbi:response regulator [Geothrix edaphica]|uniref:DNA-binding response regulator n=1 Tax=Geothrix edaphica TaxID=2927976 RepID=A0ABQ5Q0A2_9BACT|nr:response regulator [Geothrix edaphica]GLH67721.1 DNA-binding response regulator [Geothrix edaphica]
MKLLLVEDNRALSEWLARTLRADKYTVECAQDGLEADGLLRTEVYDLVILDLALPGLDGREILKRLRSRRNAVPVLILTAFDATRDRVEGLDFGADDYMVKPFEVHELEARIRALLRRVNQQKNPVFACGSLVYDSNRREFTLAGAPLALTPREHAVLEGLMMKAGRTVSKKALAESLYSLDQDVNPDAIEIYVHRLRRKLEPGDAVIVTLRGLGYLLKPRHEV